MPRHGSVPASLGREERLESGRICRHILYSAYLRLKASLLERFIGTCLGQHVSSGCGVWERQGRKRSDINNNF